MAKAKLAPVPSTRLGSDGSVIEIGVPIPPTAALGQATKYQVVRELEVGESVVLPGAIHGARQAVFNAGRALGRKYTCRKVSEKETRVFRIA